jgi:endonuclease/exonuclease/phosphatase family metal-dependent hydrolase
MESSDRHSVNADPAPRKERGTSGTGGCIHTAKMAFSVTLDFVRFMGESRPSNHRYLFPLSGAFGRALRDPLTKTMSRAVSCALSEISMGNWMTSISSNSRKRRKLIVYIILGLIVFVPVIQVYTARNYLDPNEPYFSGNFAVENPKSVETLTIVSYNIWFGEKIDQSVFELKEIDSQNELDIVLLQEMDEVGTERIARELKMNYVYFPAAIEPTYDKNFGNAILSRWPIIDSQKLILPHKSFSNRMNRIATRATIQIPGDIILVYSLHTESVFSLPRYRKEQYTVVLDDVNLEDEHVIVGGDFNSFSQSTVEELEDSFRQAGFVRASIDSGNSVVKFGIELTTDHIFAKGFIVEETGKLTGATASDHLPIWVTLIPK